MTGADLGGPAGRVQVRSLRVRERARFFKFLRVRGGFKICECGTGADKKFQPAQDSIININYQRSKSSRPEQSSTLRQDRAVHTWKRFIPAVHNCKSMKLRVKTVE